MNHTATSITSIPVTEQVAEGRNQDWKPLLKRIFAWLTPYARSDRYAIRQNRKNNSFIDEYLIDPQLGPEISRSLRR